MDKQRPKPELIGFGDAVLISVVLGIGCGVAGFVVGFGMDIAGVHVNDASSFWVMIHGAWMGCALGVVSVLLLNWARRVERDGLEWAEQKRRKEAAKSEEQRRVAKLAADKEQKLADDLRQRELCLAQMAEISDTSIARFEMLPTDLKTAYDWLLAAQQHFRNNAYSPFWHAIEQAYESLGYFNMRVAAIETLASQYARTVKEFRRAGGDGSVPSFPVRVDMANATSASEAVLNVANGVVYRAQCEAVFAQIWEQRRTTAAVVVGFANLEQAVNGMAQTVQSSVSSLVSTLTGMPGDTGPDDAGSHQAKQRLNEAVQSLYDERWRASPLS